MAFTDDDLKRIKDRSAYYREISAQFDGPLTVDEVDALLARLEAAERVCEAWLSDGPVLKHYNAWHKTAGK